MSHSTGESGWIHSTETFGTADGPGIRYVLFLAGCPLRCLYCHNPDSWHRHDGTETPVQEVLRDIGLYRRFLAGRGGVTLSGGEPLTQPAFCKKIIAGSKAMGLHTALDTSGFLGSLADDELLDDLDLVLLDIKSFSATTYEKLTSQPLAPTLAFAEALAARTKPVWLRYVLVPGLTDRPDEIRALARFAADLGNVERVDVLPFHKLGEYKWRDRGIAYQLERTPVPDTETIRQARDIFAGEGLKTT